MIQYFDSQIEDLLILLFVSKKRDYTLNFLKLIFTLHVIELSFDKIYRKMSCVQGIPIQWGLIDPSL